MKTLNKIALTFILFLPMTVVQSVHAEDLPTIRQQMQVIHDHFDVNFIYDSSIGLDIPSQARIRPARQTLEACLDSLFIGTGICWEIQKKYVVLTHEGKRRNPKNYTIFVEERHDTLRESVITALTAKERNTTQTGFQKIDGKSFNKGFAVLSSPDVIKTLQNLPGVASGTELLSGMYVRGGDGSDNLYLLDGVPMYQVSHLLGLFSSFNTDVVQSVDFYKSGFPARYGGRLSSVVDVRTREGNMNEYHGIFSIGLLDGRIQLEGPIVKGKTSFNIGLRRSWLDVLTEPASLVVSKVEKSDFRIKYAFWDLNANVTHRFSDHNRLSLNIYGGRDAAKFRQGDKTEESDNGSQVRISYQNEAAIGLEWGNFLGSVDWDFRFTPEHEIVAKAYISRYSSLFSGLENSKEVYSMDEIPYSTYKISENRSRTTDLGLKADLSFRPSETHHLRYGASLMLHRYSPEYLSDEHITENNVEIRSQHFFQNGLKRSWEASAYFEDEMSVAEWMTANLGLRYSSILTDGKGYHSLQPRAALRIICGGNTSLKLSYSEMVQNDHLISSNYLMLPTNFWMPSTEKIAPSHSRQISAGVYINLPHNIRFSTEGYYKTMSNLLEFRGKWGIYPPIHLWEEAMTVGKGRSWGMETEVSWTDENTSLTAYYTLSWSQRLFEEFYPAWYKDRNDNRHKITLMGTRKLGKRCEVYASWNFHSGGWVTAESHGIWSEELGSYPINFYEKPNNIKIPDYHRLDIGFNFRKTTKRGNESIWNLSVYNVYCSMNPFVVYTNYAYDFTKENLSGLSYIGEAFGIIPIIPSFSYTLKF